VKVGFFGANVGAMASGESGNMAALAESLGYSSLWVAEHMVVPKPRPDSFSREPQWNFADPLVALGYIAAHTTSIELCTGVLLLPQRHPVHLAKELSTLDVLCQGRLIAGVGVGHLEAEMNALGVAPDRRQDRAMESIQAMRALWTMENPEFKGEFWSFSGIDAYPRPVQAAGPRIVMGGHSPAALRRAVRYSVGWYGWGRTPAQLREDIDNLKRAAEAMGSPLDGYSISVTPPMRMTTDLAREYERAGAHQIVISVESDDIDGVRRRLEHNAPRMFGLD
jgi:probable F420-dependent oxidoreductase